MKTYHHFKKEERFVLATYLREGFSIRSTSKKLSRRVSAVSYEIKHNSQDSTRKSYDPEYADLLSKWRKHDANRRNPLKSPVVWQYVVDKLREDWSPEQISNRIQLEHKHNPQMRISHETIYQFINSKESKELVTHLRKGKFRKHRRRYHPTGRKEPNIPNRVSIRARPVVAESRKRYGDWEGDLMLGRIQRGAVVAAQCERKSRFLCLTKAEDRSASEHTRIIQTRFAYFPKVLKRTLTLDNGKENVGHAQYGITTFFCDPYCSWQKGSIENSIGLVRQYLPKGKSLNDLTAEHLQTIEDKLNNRPRKCLGWRTPAEVLSTHLTHLGVQLPA